MPKTVISILGTAGLDFKTKEPKKVYYDCSAIGIESGKFYNATDVLLNRFNANYYFIGTKYAIEFQKKLLNLKDLSIEYIEVKDDSLDEVFDAVLELLSMFDDVLLDVTHGFRHQPIMAIFSATLSRFLQKGNLQVVYAKVIDSEQYEYIFLDNYIEISTISLLLTGFIRTLNFIPVNNMKLLNNRVFEDFSKSLLANDLKGVEKNYSLLQNELTILEQNKELLHIKSLLNQVKNQLKPLENFANQNKYTKYLTLSKITVDKNYLVVALAYIFESLRTYSNIYFENICANIEYKNDFDRKQDIMNAITNSDEHRNESKNRIYKKHKNFYKNNKYKLDRVASIYLDIRKLRNQLAHINEEKEFEDIKKMVKTYIFKVEVIYKDKVFDKLTYSQAKK